MLVLILLWLLLSVITFTIGLGLLHILRADCILRQGDRLFIALWLGLFTLAWALFTISLVLPLSPWVGLAVGGGLMAIALSQTQTRQESLTLIKTLISLPWPWQVAGLGLTLATAFFSAQGIIWFDTGLYHYQAIEWFRQYGTVPGLALIHERFSTNSAWFALAAPLNFGILSAKITACLGGLIFLIGLFQTAIILHRILHKTEQFTDWFLGLAMFLIIPTLFWSSLPFSISPDQPIIFVTVITAWVMLIILKERNLSQDQSILIPLILTATGTTIKLSALPLVVLTFCFYVFTQSNTSFIIKFSQNKIHQINQYFKLILKPAIQGGFLALICISPLFAFNIFTSGCMLFPSSLFCFDLPWSLSLTKVQKSYQEIKEWNRWIGATPTGETLGWVQPWIHAEKQFTFLIFCSVITIWLLLIYHPKIAIKGKQYVMIMATLGLIYVLTSAPTWRFGLGYACLLPAFLMAEYCYHHSRKRILSVLLISGAANAWLEFSSPSFILIFCLTFLSIIGIYFYPKITEPQFFTILSILSFLIISRHYLLTYAHNRINVKIYPIFPPSLQETYAPHKFKALQTNDVTYFVPTDGTELCWAAPLPCTYALSDQNIQLRDPDRGIGAGFIKVPIQSQ
ncbi:hypothetical protein VB712_11580 [Spirulina sp. CCNP1310]|uniref:LIC_10190 family membrane protein n=1 Tax=Spirulina sp. CCNP1310 TaxID=3110249 RepID=UPI002B1FC474|nr:hypothetical protein [Spirulina sp. CCNP1310]MEA5419866.1 hypothetical protein [Spirulina sp. CCNP1310]